MSTQKKQLKPQEVHALADHLLEMLRKIDKDDLSSLAKMHGWCESLVHAGQGTTAECRDLAGRLARELEHLILGEVTDAAESFSLITQGVNELFVAIQTPDVSAIADPIPSTSNTLDGKPIPPASELTNHSVAPTDNIPSNTVTDAELEEKLAAIFDDPATAALANTSEAVTSQTQETAPSFTANSTDEISDELARALLEEMDQPAPKPATEPSPAQTEPTPAAEIAIPPYESIPLLIDVKELDFVKGFVEEASEHIQSIENAVLEVERVPEDTGKIDDLFRPFHTIKGMAGFLNLRDINCLTHEVETLLDQGRKGKRPVTPGMIDLIFSVVDILKAQIAAVSAYLANPTGDAVPQPPVASMIDHLRQVVAGKRELESTSSTPALSKSVSKVGEALVEQGVVSSTTLQQALEIQNTQGNEKKVGEILIEMGAATSRDIGQALRQTRPATSTTSAVSETSIRIDTAKLDALVDMVGELVIAQTLVGANALIASDLKLAKDVSQVNKIVRDVQETAMAMRMVQIGGTFQKMARLVRDVSRKAGKQVNLTISGEDTELDKNVIQQISDPLVHMVRNAVDHGIEPADARLAAGKPEIGQVHLGAYHQGGNIVIEISDDGRGLDPDKLTAKAIEKGIVPPGEELTREQAFALIFAPGFSTAEKVTDISGRGVGMDVVKRNIDQLRGKIEITSEKGKGSTFQIRLPLTLAIIDGMVIKCGNERFIIPTITIEQSLQPRPEIITSVQQRGEVLNVRGRLIPLVQLGQLFGLTERVNPCEHMVVIASVDTQAIGIVVDELIGQQQVVIKTLGERFNGLKGVSGAAILGDGRVGLILEPSGVLSLHNTRKLPALASDGNANNVCD